MGSMMVRPGRGPRCVRDREFSEKMICLFNDFLRVTASHPTMACSPWSQSHDHHSISLMLCNSYNRFVGSWHHLGFVGEETKTQRSRKRAPGYTPKKPVSWGSNPSYVTLAMCLRCFSLFPSPVLFLRICHRTQIAIRV